MQLHFCVVRIRTAHLHMLVQEQKKGVLDKEHALEFSI